tara:strand:- start:126 stop:656 length:531 start_codon:yes stop_codon:yes gene_type:complete
MAGMDDKEKLREYGYAPIIFKQFLEDVFGESHLISVDDGQAGTNKIIFSGDIQGIASYTAQLEHHSAHMQVNFYYNLLELDFLEEIDARSLQVDNKELDEMVDEIENYLYSLDDYNLDSETFGNYNSGNGDEFSATTIECNILLDFEPLFSDAKNLLSMLRDIDTKIKSIIKEHDY